MASFHNLPVEVQEQIFLNLNPHDLKNCSLVSSTWHYIINSNRIWQKVCEREKIADKSFLHDYQSSFKNPLMEYSSNNHFAPMCYWKSHFSRYKFLKRNWRTGRYVTVHLPFKPIHISERFVVEDLDSSLKIWEVYGEIKEFCSVPNVFPGVKIDNFSSNENFIVYTQQRHLLCLKKLKSSFKQQFQIELEYKKCRHYRGCDSTISELEIRLTEKFILVLDPAMPCNLKFYTFDDNIAHKSIDLHKTVGKPTSFSFNICKVTKEKVFFSYTASWEPYLIMYDLIRESWDSPIILDYNIVDIYPSEKYVCVKMFSGEEESTACVWDHSVKTSPPVIRSLLVSEDSPIVFTSQDMVIFGRREIFTGNYDIIVQGLVCNYVKVLSVPYEVYQFCPVWDNYLVVLSQENVSVWEWDKESKINTLFRDANLIDFNYCDVRVSETNIILKRRNLTVVSYW